MLGSANLKALVDENLSVRANAKAVVEFNANQYFEYDFIGIYASSPAATYSIDAATGLPAGTDFVTRYVTRQSVTKDAGSDNPVVTLIDEEDKRYPELFPLEHIFKPDRPGPGIVKLAADTRVVGTQNYAGPHVLSSATNRYYPPTYKSPFKYWRSGNVSQSGGTIADANPFIHYKDSFYINSIKVAVQTYNAVPSVYSLQVLLPDSGTPTTWTTVYSNTDGTFPASGVLQVYYDNVGSWTTSALYVDTLLAAGSTQAVKINGLRFVVSSMAANPAALEVVELSPRLVVDATDRLQSYEVDLSVSEEDSPLPVGSVSAQVGSMKLLDYDGLMDTKTSTSVLYKYGTKGAVVQLLGRFYGTTLAGGQEDIRLAYLYVDKWSPDAERQITVKLIDAFSIFQRSPAPRAIFSGKTLTQIIRRIADWIGFSNIQFYKHDENASEDPVIPMFICSDKRTAYDVIRDLAEAHQCSIFIDGYNVMRIYSKERLLNDTLVAQADFGLRYAASGNKKPNVKSIPEVSDGQPVNDIKVGYKQHYLEYAATETDTNSALWNAQKTAKRKDVWEDSAEATLAAAAIVSPLGGSAISQYVVSGNVATVTTKVPHNLSTGEWILIENTKPYTVTAVDYTIDGTYQVASVPSTTSLTVAVAGLAASGTVNPGGGSVGGAVVLVDQEAGVAFPEEGYFLLDSEIIFYSGKQWSYKPDGGTAYTYEWCSSDEETAAAQNRMADGSRFYFTGALRIAKRGQMGTEVRPHYIPSSTSTPGEPIPNWRKFPIMNWSTRDFFASSQVIPVRYTNNSSTSPVRSTNHSMIRLTGITPDEVAARWGWSNVVNDVRTQSLLVYTTEAPVDLVAFNRVSAGLRILGRTIKEGSTDYGPRGLDGVTGVCMDWVGNGGTMTGWFLEVEMSQQAPADNVRIVKYLNGVRSVVATATYKINADIFWANPSIGDVNFQNMHIVELYRDYTSQWINLTAYIDGNLVLRAQAAASGSPAPYMGCGVFVRGNTYADIDYFLADAPTFSSSDAATGERGYPYTLNGGVSQPAINMLQTMFNNKSPQRCIYEEFGPLAHEVEVKKADFSSTPTINPKLINTGAGTNESQYYILKYTSTPFSAEWIAVNAGRHWLASGLPRPRVNGYPILTVGREYTMSEYLDDDADSTGNISLQKRSDVLQGIIKKSISKYGKINMSIESDYIQTRKAARSLLEWIAQYAAFDCERLELEVFGNPLIEPGDMCTLNLTPLHETGYNGNQRFLVTRARHSFDKGYSTNLVLRRITD